MEQSCSSPVRRTWGLGPSRVSASHRRCGVAHWRALAGLGQSLLFAGMQMTQMLFLESLKLTLCVGGLLCEVCFFSYQLSLWVNTASPGENDRVAEAPGNIGAVALHRHRPSSVLASCRTGFPAALGFEVAVLLPRNVNVVLEPVQHLIVFCT